MVDTEYETFVVLAHAMTELVPGVPAEVLVADASQSQFELAAVNPAGGPAGCGVGSPLSCAAVRRGSTAVFDSSNALDSCPRLRNRPFGACSAVCAPVSFMGRALGVIHVVADEHAPVSATKIHGLETLASLSGTRIGTLRALAQTQRQAMTDVLTGLSNRRDAEPRLQRLLERNDQVAVVMVDLDRFKLLNDTHGHEVGDRALRVFARTLTQSFREVDLISRWGGEEFLLALPGLNASQASDIVERVRLALATTALTGGLPAFTASFGIADMSHTRSMEQLIRVADTALYEAKNAGRDCYRIASPHAPDRAAVRVPSHGDCVDPAQLARSLSTTKT